MQFQSNSFFSDEIGKERNYNRGVPNVPESIFGHFCLHDIYSRHFQQFGIKFHSQWVVNYCSSYSINWCLLFDELRGKIRSKGLLRLFIYLTLYWNIFVFIQILLTISCTGASLFLFTLATYSYFRKSGHDLSSFKWIPIMSLSLVILIASLGIISLPFVITTEIMPNKVWSYLNIDELWFIKFICRSVTSPALSVWVQLLCLPS